MNFKILLLVGWPFTLLAVGILFHIHDVSTFYVNEVQQKVSDEYNRRYWVYSSLKRLPFVGSLVRGPHSSCLHTDTPWMDSWAQLDLMDVCYKELGTLREQVVLPPDVSVVKNLFYPTAVCAIGLAVGLVVVVFWVTVRILLIFGFYGLKAMTRKIFKTVFYVLITLGRVRVKMTQFGAGKWVNLATKLKLVFAEGRVALRVRLNQLGTQVLGTLRARFNIVCTRLWGVLGFRIVSLGYDVSSVVKRTTYFRKRQKRFQRRNNIAPSI